MIQTHDLTKVYGSLHAIDSLEISLGERDVFGFIGPNGAGKTTTMKILTTLLEPSWGEATVCGYSIYTGTSNLDEDLDAVMNGFVSITPLTVNRTAMDAYNRLSGR